MDFSTLQGNDLRKFYQSFKALQRGVEDPSTINLPDKDDGWYQRSLSRAATNFDTGGDIADERTQVGDKLKSPKQKWQQTARNAIGGQKLTASDILLIEVLANNLYNYPVTVNGNIDDNDRSHLAAILKQQDRGLDADAVGAGGAFLKATIAEEATRAEKIKFDAAQKITTLDAGTVSLGYGRFDGKLNLTEESVLGKPGHELDKMLADYSEALQRKFKTNIFDIRKKMFTGDDLSPTPFATDVVKYLSENGDFKNQISAQLTSNDEIQIKQAQGLLRLSGAEDVQTTGKLDAVTAEAAIKYLEAEKGMGDTTFMFTKAKEGSEYPYNISSFAIKKGLMNGSIPLELQGLPEAFRADLDGLNKLEQTEEIASFLAQETNYTAYNNYLKGRDNSALTADLKSKLPALQEAGAAEAARKAVAAAEAEAQAEQIRQAEIAAVGFTPIVPDLDKNFPKRGLPIEKKPVQTEKFATPDAAAFYADLDPEVAKAEGVPPTLRTLALIKANIIQESGNGGDDHPSIKDKIARMHKAFDGHYGNLSEEGHEFSRKHNQSKAGIAPTGDQPAKKDGMVLSFQDARDNKAATKESAAGASPWSRFIAAFRPD